MPNGTVIIYKKPAGKPIDVKRFIIKVPEKKATKSKIISMIAVKSLMASVTQGIENPVEFVGFVKFSLNPVVSLIT